MKIRLCDKCKKDITTRTLFKLALKQEYTDLIMSTEFREKEFELCSICKEEVLDLLKNEIHKKHK